MKVLQAIGMAHLLSRLSSRMRDEDDLDCVRRCLEEFCGLYDYEMEVAAPSGFWIEKKKGPQQGAIRFE